MAVHTSEKFDWRPEYSVGVQEIDEQHKHFFSLMDVLHDLAQSNTATADQLQGAINKLDAYAKFHFSTEEKYFKKFNYMDTEHHINAHHHYVGRVADLSKRLRAPDSDMKKLADDLAEFAASWLIGHIIIEDKKYSEFFKSHGLT